MKSFIAFIICLASSLSINAQTDYIITIKGDTILGEGKVIDERHIKFKQQGEQKFTEKTAGDFKEIYLSKKDEFYVYKITNPTQPSVLFKRLESGRINLYEFKIAAYGGGSKVTWFAEKNGQGFS